MSLAAVTCGVCTIAASREYGTHSAGTGTSSNGSRGTRAAGAHDDRRANAAASTHRFTRAIVSSAAWTRSARRAGPARVQLPPYPGSGRLVRVILPDGSTRTPAGQPALPPVSEHAGRVAQGASADLMESNDSEEGYLIYTLRAGDGAVQVARLADDSPMCIEDAYLADSIVPNFLDQPLPDSLYEDLQRRDLMPTWGEDSVDAALARPEEGELLGINPGSPVLRIARRAFAGSIAIEVSRSTFRADRYTLWMPLSRPNSPVTRGR